MQSDEAAILPEWLKYLVEWVIRLPNRIKCRLTYAREFKACVEAIASMRDLERKACSIAATTGREMSRSRQVINLNLYLLLISYDLLEFKRDVQLVVGTQRRGFVARHLALLLHESMEELPKLLGRSYRDTLAVLGLPEEFINRLNPIASEFADVRRQRQEFLGLIRNLVVAHREHDASLQLEVMDSIDPLEVMRCGVEFSRPLNRLVQFQTEALSRGVRMEGLLRDLLDRTPPPGGKESKAKVKWRRRSG